MKTTILVNKKAEEIETQPFTVICHNNDLKIDVPDFFEINAHNTIGCIDTMSQAGWDNVRTGGVFKPLFDMVFQDTPLVLPEKIEDLREMNDGVKHVSGMIVLMFEHAYIKGEKIFLRLPETHLHPKQVRHLPDMMKQIQNLCDSKSNVLTKIEPIDDEAIEKRLKNDAR